VAQVLAEGADRGRRQIESLAILDLALAVGAQPMPGHLGAQTEIDAKPPSKTGWDREFLGALCPPRRCFSVSLSNFLIGRIDGPSRAFHRSVLTALRVFRLRTPSPPDRARYASVIGEMEMAFQDSYAHFCVHLFNQRGLVRGTSWRGAWW
jgi:hypothetical protein